MPIISGGAQQKKNKEETLINNIVQIYVGITPGRVLNGECYAQRLHKLIYLHLFTDCFMKISREIFMKQSVNKYT